MKDKELKLEEIEVSHTGWSVGRSYPGEREVEKVNMLSHATLLQNNTLSVYGRAEAGTRLGGRTCKNKRT